MAGNETSASKKEKQCFQSHACLSIRFADWQDRPLQIPESARGNIFFLFKDASGNTFKLNGNDVEFGFLSRNVAPGAAVLTYVGSPDSIAQAMESIRVPVEKISGKSEPLPERKGYRAVDYSVGTDPPAPIQGWMSDAENSAHKAQQWYHFCDFPTITGKKGISLQVKNNPDSCTKHLVELKETRCEYIAVASPSQSEYNKGDYTAAGNKMSSPGQAVRWLRKMKEFDPGRICTLLLGQIIGDPRSSDFKDKYRITPYTEGQIQAVQRSCIKNCFNFTKFTSRAELGAYLKVRVGPKGIGPGMNGGGRQELKIKGLAFFGHGHESKISLGYNAADEEKKRMDIDRNNYTEVFSKDCFAVRAFIELYTCRPGAPPGNNLLQDIADSTGAVAIGLQKRSEYRYTWAPTTSRVQNILQGLPEEIAKERQANERPGPGVCIPWPLNKEYERTWHSKVDKTGCYNGIETGLGCIWQTNGALSPVVPGTTPSNLGDFFLHRPGKPSKPLQGWDSDHSPELELHDEDVR
jgi:hypothetical protein